MTRKLKFDARKVYPTLVVSTMSSGKSTVINALLGTELMPSTAQACTARTVEILDNDMKPEFEIHAVDSKGVYSLDKHATLDAVKGFNSSNNVSEMIIEGDIKGIKNSRKALMLVDTPGVDFGGDLSHEKITKKAIEDCSEGLLLYIFEVNRMACGDDSEFLDWVADRLKNNDKLKILFVINKMDLVDCERENPGEMVEKWRDYVVGKGIENPVVIPISARSALMFKKILAGTPLSEFETEEFSGKYEYFKRGGYSLQDYVSVPDIGKLDKKVVIDGKEYTNAQIYAALENTGLPFLERQIDKMLVKSLKIKSPKINISAKHSKKESAPKKPRRTTVVNAERKATKQRRERKTKR